MHNPFSLYRLISPPDLGHEPITAALIHGELIHSFKGIAGADIRGEAGIADRIMLGTEKGTLLVFDLSHASTSSSESLQYH
jgi:hypothetical protein